MTTDTQFRDLLREALERDPDVPTSVAVSRFVERLREENPTLLLDWLNERAERVVAKEAAKLRPSKRSKRAQFQTAARKFSGGDYQAMHPFRQVVTVDMYFTQKKVGDLNKQDHLYLASEATRSKNAAMLAEAFHAAIAKRLSPGQTTKDVMTEEEYVRLWRSITRARLAMQR